MDMASHSTQGIGDDERGPLRSFTNGGSCVPAVQAEQQQRRVVRCTSFKRRPRKAKKESGSPAPATKTAAAPATKNAAGGLYSQRLQRARTASRPADPSVLLSRVAAEETGIMIHPQ